MFMLVFQPCLMATPIEVFTPSPLRRPYLTLGCFLMASSSARRAAVVSLVSARGNHIDRYLGPREGRIGPLSRFHFSLAAAFVSCLRRPRGRAGRGRRVALGLGADAVGSLRGKALLLVLHGSAHVDVFVQRVEPLLEALERLSKAAAQLRQLRGAEEEQGQREHDDDLSDPESHCILRCLAARHPDPAAARECTADAFWKAMQPELPGPGRKLRGARRRIGVAPRFPSWPPWGGLRPSPSP